jgi:hypothetical protein
VGASVFAQMAIFLAVSYFGQTIMIWYLTLAMAAFLAEGMAVERARDGVRAGAAREEALARRRERGVTAVTAGARSRGAAEAPV